VFGRVARGPRRELLTACGWEDARKWGLSTVVDLRCADEVGPRAGDPQPGITPGVVVVVNTPTEDQEDPEFRRVCFPILDSPEYWEHNWRLQPHLVRGTFQAISRATPGVLIHCGLGRDRTGMITALLLGNAGVSPDDVAADYAASVHAALGVASHGSTTDPQASWMPARRERSLADMLQWVRNTAANADDILAALGIAVEVRERLRSLLVVAECPTPPHQ
jgi:hypothetical protein